MRDLEGIFLFPSRPDYHAYPPGAHLNFLIGQRNVECPLTPALSLRERENRSPVSTQIVAQQFLAFHAFRRQIVQTLPEIEMLPTEALTVAGALTFAISSAHRVW